MLLNARVRAAMLDTVAIEGRITVNNSDEMRRKLLAALRSRPAQVIVDLSQTTYMDSSGLATLLEAVRIARKQDTRLLLAGVSGQPRCLFQIGQIDRVFEFVTEETSG
jgi:anti-sigma B factor antagonist